MIALILLVVCTLVWIFCERRAVFDTSTATVENTEVETIREPLGLDSHQPKTSERSDEPLDGQDMVTDKTWEVFLRETSKKLIDDLDNETNRAMFEAKYIILPVFRTRA